MSLILSKTGIHPIILPQQYFKDRFQQSNAFLEMNPSMHIDEQGKVTILVRCINYRKFYNKQFTMYEPHSQSNYKILTGTIQPNSPLDLDQCTVQDLQYHTILPTYPTYWKGMEDIRFITSNTLLVTLPECNPNGNPSIFHATLEDNQIHIIEACKPDYQEKNWMPYPTTNGFSVIYSVDPFIIKDWKTESKTQVIISNEIASEIKGYHGSTNGIAFEQNYLFLIHVNRERSYHRWLLFDPTKHTVQVSDEFIFFAHSYIEFPVSICQYADQIFISMGVNDDKAMIVETQITDIQSLFPLHRSKPYDPYKD
jgi:predicted GH43/DUF377 family glycosyl hydrolase